MANSPWGTIDKVTRVAPNLAWVDTPSHGGLRVAQAWGQMNLSLAALSRAERRHGYYWFEEDLAYALPCWELRQLRPHLFAHRLGGQREAERLATLADIDQELHQIITHWYPGYWREVDRTTA